MSLAILKKLLLGQRGFTAVEMVVAAALTGLVASAAGPATYNALNAVTATQAVITTQGWSNTARWYSQDVANVTTTDLVEGASPVSTMNLQWTDSDGILHSSTYGLVGDTLERTYDGVAHPMARHLVSAGFSLAENVITADLVVEDDGVAGSIYLTALMRTSGATAQ